MVQKLDILKNKGFIIQIDEPSRVNAIKWSIDENGYFTENVSYPDLRPQAIGLYLIGFSREVISCVAIGLQTGRTSTQSDRIKLKRICKIKEKGLVHYLPDGALGQELDNRLAEQSDISIEANSMNQILIKIANQNPEQEDDINTLIRLANGIEYDDEKKNKIFSQQKDAVLFSMNLASINSEIVTEDWEIDAYEDAESFLEPISNEHAIEDYLLNFDQDFFLDCALSPFFGPPEIRFFRPFHSDGLVTPPGLCIAIGTLYPIAL